MDDKIYQDWMTNRACKAQDEIERQEMKLRLRNEWETIRVQRAHRTATSIISLMANFIPEAARQGAYDEALLMAFWANAEIIEVPEECDNLDKKELEMRRLEQSMKPIRVRVEEKG